MADFRLPSLRRNAVGQGRPIAPERAGLLNSATIDFPDFTRGIDLRDVEQDQDGTNTQEGINFRVDSAGRLQRVEGHLIAETMSGGRMIRSMILQTSLDFTTELLLFDSPYVGVKTHGATVWFNASLPDGNSWAGINNLDKILLTNGTTGIYRRDFGVNSVSLVSASPAGVDIANFAGRVWVLGPTYPMDAYQALGIGWSADAEGLSWTGLGSGAQLLIADTGTDDRGVALRAINFDLMAVLCQRSLWIGRPTGDIFEPAIFEPRVFGVGCVARDTACLVPGGIIFLSNSGVYMFDGNTAQLLSSQIHRDLLPLLTNAVTQYSAVYDHRRAEYLLFTPTETWVYELKHGRWLRWGFRATRAAAFSEQFSGVTWNNIEATWSTIDGSWEDLAPPVGQVRVVYGYRDKLAVPSADATTFIDGSSAMARYGFLRRDAMNVNDLFEIQRLRLRHQGGDDALAVWLPDTSGELTAVATKSLPSHDEQAGVELGLRHVSLGVGAQIRWQDPSLQISKAQIIGMRRSKKQGVL